MSDRAPSLILHHNADPGVAFELSEEIEGPTWDEWDVIGFDNDTPRGIIVVGQAQAGKTTLTSELIKLWPAFCDETHPLQFSNSNGFRGSTHEILTWANWSSERQVPSAVFADILGEYVESPEIEKLPDILPSYYSSPPGPDVLRSPAVDSAVASTSEHLTLRPLINEVGAVFLSQQIACPEKYGLPARPGLVVLDARNQMECRNKFARAGVMNIGTIILTCPEEVIAQRKLGANAEPADLRALADLLRARNTTDRNRSLAPMTMPDDVKFRFTVDQMHSEVQLYEAGVISVSEPDSGIVFRTDQLTIAQERDALGLLLAGMLNEG